MSGNPPKPTLDQDGEIEPTFANLLLFTLSTSGELIRRRPGSGKTVQIANEIRVEAESFLRREMVPQDVNAEICELLVMRWKRSRMRGQSINSRFRWFEKCNAVAAALGWADVIDFSHIKPTRIVDWTSTRLNVDLPEFTPEPNSDVDPEHSGESRMLLLDMLEKHYMPARLVGKSKNTIRLYRVCIRNFSRWLGRQPIVGDLNIETVGAYLQHALDNTDLSPHTIEKERAEFTSFWNFAAKRGWLKTFPDIPSINCPKRIPDAWTDDEMTRLMKACETARGMIGSNQAKHYWPALVSTIYDSGERISATLSILQTDIDGNGWLTVRGEYRKGKTRDKRYRLRPATLKRIAKMNAGKAPVFDFPFHPNYIYNLYSELLDDAGLPSTRRDKFHKIRRTTASNFEAAGGNATALLDHTDRRTTEAYLDPRLLKEVQPADIVPGIGEGPTEHSSQPEQDDSALVDQFRSFLNQQKRSAK